MPALIFIIAALAFWIHAERKLNFTKRVVGGIVFWGSCLLFLHYAHNVGSNYERTYVARTMKNVATDASVERRQEYLKLAESYEKRIIGGGQLMLESEEILSRSNTKKAEQE
jgi:predicted membrane protein